MTPVSKAVPEAAPRPTARRLALPAAARLVVSVALSMALAGLAGGCAPMAPAKPPPPAPSLAELMQRPAERALIEGIRHYDEGQYALAEVQLRKALTTGLVEARDRASAHKLLAFITCTSERMADCAAQFSAARAADPQFQLSRSEQGHPLWGPVYRRALAPTTAP
ncbi:MAG: TssQ family T6SS-associated lipoprotein [Rubrivivax sp.]|nr:TssQ family T6SS-associated lipoprotein [Rubrivivax sp.]